MVEILKFEEKYRESLKNICYETASDFFKTNDDSLYLMFLFYYLDFESENCFVLVDDGVPKGYILCSANPKLYRQKLKEIYLPKLKAISKDKYRQLKLDLFVSSVLKSHYPCHMHIDILDDLRGQGYGRKLVETLLNKLKQDHKKGLYLCCGKENINAIKFYQKVGFKKGPTIGGVFFFKRIN